MLAVDACLGQAEQIGSIAIALGPVKPGAGVNKVLPAVGTLHITGTVNVAGFMEYLVLQNTRLSLVMQMARVISDAIPIGFGLAKSTRSEATCRALEAR
jgi:putative sporulation protein YyaC